MSGWAVFGIVLAVFVLIGCIPVGVDASYRENELALRLKIGLFKLQVLPAKEKKFFSVILILVVRIYIPFWV